MRSPSLVGRSVLPDGTFASLLRTPTVMAVAVLLSACGGGGEKTTAPTPPPPPITLLVKNYLYVPVALSSGGVGYGTLSGGNGFGPAQVSLTLPGSASSLDVAVQPLRFSDGSAIPSDLTGGSFTLGSGTNITANITNVLSGQQYVMASFSNQSGSSLMVAVAQGGVVQCIGTWPAVTSAVELGWLGYYRLNSTTEIRLYNAGTQCSGAYLYWNATALSGYSTNSGVVLLITKSAPEEPVASIAIASSSASVPVGQTLQFTATLKDASGRTLTGRTVAWSSSAGNVASVSASGLMTALSTGTTTITAASEGKSATATATVTQAVVDRVTICDRAFTSFCNTSSSIFAGTVVSVRATAYNTANVDVSSACAFVWNSSVPGIVTIVPSTDATHRDAVITRLVNYTTVGVTATCQGHVGVFSP